MFIWPHKMILYFLHIPKTAGSSVNRWLTERVGTGNVCPAKNWDHLVGMKPQEIREFTVFSGHFGIDLSSFLGRRVVTVSVFRDPLSRTISHYNHVRRDLNHPYHNYVRTQSFDEFVIDRKNWPMIENFQARYLANSPIDFKRYAQRLDGAAEKSNRLSTTSEDSRYLLDKTYVIETAHKTLDSLKVVGTTDRLGVFFVNLSRTLSFKKVSDDEEIPFENRSMPGQEIHNIHPKTLEIVDQLTKIDQEIYELVSKRNLA